MARRVSLPSADDLFRTTEEEKAAKARAARSTPYPTSRSPRPHASPAAGSSTTRR